MRRNLLWLLLLIPADLAAKPSFFGEIRPILQKQCQGCHQPSAKSSDLDLTTYAGFKKGGKRGPGFVAGQPDESITLRYLTAAVQPQMPLGQPPLKAAEI